LIALETGMTEQRDGGSVTQILMTCNDVMSIAIKIMYPTLSINPSMSIQLSWPLPHRRFEKFI